MRELLGELTRALCDVRSPVGEEAALAEQLAYRSDAERIGNSVVLGRAAGAKPVYAVGEGHGWRLGRVEDPFGHHWEIGKPLGAWPPKVGGH